MAQTKQTARKTDGLPCQPPQQPAWWMTASCWHPSTPPPSLKTKKCKRFEDIGFDAEICTLEANIVEHPFPELKQPQQAPAMMHYHAAPKAQPKKKKQKWKKWKKVEPEDSKPETLTEPKTLMKPETLMEPETLSSLTKSKVPALQRSEATWMQPEIIFIDLTQDEDEN